MCTDTGASRARDPEAAGVPRPEGVTVPDPRAPGAQGSRAPDALLPRPPGALARLAPLLVLAQMCSLQLGAAVAKTTYERVDPVVVAGMRLGFAALFLALLVRPRLRALSRAQWLGAAALGLVFAGNNLTFFLALGRLPLGVAATVELLGPLLLAVALSRRPAQLAAGLLAVCGVLLLGAPGGDLPLAGLGFALAAAGCRTAYVLLSKRVGRLFTDFTGLSVALLVGACVLVPVAAVHGGAAVAASPSVLLPGGAVAVLSSLVPYALDMAVLRRIDSRAFGVLLALTPAVGALVGLVFLHEPLGRREAAAITLVVAATVWSSQAASSRRP
ncbi:membrane protein [Streptomyces minutiscleroticus]|uniref:Membrane protein n=1 Tax=Streptomyces minutiscleroticus TaxID=68238 RepID=A0A918U4T1_9ACTN|nr:EamA family transporter [Streptomyces minutiscleroticus]GGX92468.1 membrane protein [Streptomyces minutiscleroticus]